jgi:type III secretion system FlhB-like substrate exporter
MDHQILVTNNNMDEEIFEIAKENDLSLDEAEQLQEVIDNTELDVDEALEVFQDL